MRGSINFISRHYTPADLQPSNPNAVRIVVFGDNEQDEARGVGGARIGLGGQAGMLITGKDSAGNDTGVNHPNAFSIPTCDVPGSSLLPNGANSTEAEINAVKTKITKKFDALRQRISAEVKSGHEIELLLPTQEEQGKKPRASIGMGVAGFNHIPAMVDFMNTEFAKTANHAQSLGLSIRGNVPPLTDKNDKDAARDALEKLAKARPKESAMLRDNLSRLNDDDKKLLADKIEGFITNGDNTDAAYQQLISELMSLESLKKNPKLGESVKQGAEETKKQIDENTKKELTPEEKDAQLQQLIENHSKFKGLCKKEAITELSKSGFDWLAEMTDPTKAPDAPFQQFHLLKILFFLPLFLVCKGASKTLGHVKDYIQETEKTLAKDMNLPELNAVMNATAAKPAAAAKKEESAIEIIEKQAAQREAAAKKEAHEKHHHDREANPGDSSGPSK